MDGERDEVSTRFLTVKNRGNLLQRRPGHSEHEPDGHVSAGRGAAYGLTVRELTVLQLLGEGLTDKQIGRQLGIAALTAQKHASRIRAKMQAASRTEAAVRALREGLII